MCEPSNSSTPAKARRAEVGSESARPGKGTAAPPGEQLSKRNRAAEKRRAHLEITWSVAMFFNVARNEVDGKNYGEAS